MFFLEGPKILLDEDIIPATLFSKLLGRTFGNRFTGLSEKAYDQFIKSYSKALKIKPSDDRFEELWIYMQNGSVDWNHDKFATNPFSDDIEITAISKASQAYNMNFNNSKSGFFYSNNKGAFTVEMDKELRDREFLQKNHLSNGFIL